MHLTWKAAGAALLVAALTAGTAKADEFTDTIEAAMEAYQAGDIKTAKEEIDFAAQLLGQLKAEGLTGFLPPALDGWEREIGDKDLPEGVYMVCTQIDDRVFNEVLVKM